MACTKIWFAVTIVPALPITLLLGQRTCDDGEPVLPSAIAACLIHPIDACSPGLLRTPLWRRGFMMNSQELETASSQLNQARRPSVLEATTTYGMIRWKQRWPVFSDFGPFDFG